MLRKLALSDFLGSIDIADNVLKYLTIIFLGFVVYYLDAFEVVSIQVNTLVIMLISLAKVLSFVVQSVRQINHVIDKNVAYYRFLIFMLFNVIAVVISFGVDFFCLYLVNPSNFTGLSASLTTPRLVFEFVYLSMLGFNNLGFYDVTPVGVPPKVLVAVEILVYYFAIILILSDFITLRDSVLEERLKRKSILPRHSVR